MLLTKINNKYHSLTETEQKIAFYVLNHPEQITTMTAKDLAFCCDTVPSAIIRFCKSMELSGFSELKLLLAKETVRTERSERLPAFHKEDNNQTIFQKVFHSGICTLKDSLAMLDFNTIDVIVKLLDSAQNIYIFGVGTSAMIAMDAGYRFSQFGFSAHACTDQLFMNVIAGNMTPNDVAFCISHSGQTKAVVNALRRARQVGATTIALTSFADSLLHKESDFCISVYADDLNYPVEAVSARVAHLCVIDALMMALGTQDNETFEKHINIRNEVLKDIRY